MRTLLFITIVLTSCNTKTEYSFLAIKETDIYRFENSISVSEFKLKTDSLKCEGYNIVAKSREQQESNNDECIIKTICKFPKQIKFDHSDGIELPIYKCNGFRKYGINLCEDDNSNFQLLKDFYLNPNRRPDYPRNPKNATIKLVVEETMSLEALVPLITRIKSMRNKIGEGKFTKEPFLLSIETLKKDSILIKPPKPVN
jgi:hypothetical protein